VKEAFFVYYFKRFRKYKKLCLKFKDTNPKPPLGRGLSLEICVASFWCCVRKKVFFFENFSKLFKTKSKMKRK